MNASGAADGAGHTLNAPSRVPTGSPSPPPFVAGVSSSQCPVPFESRGHRFLFRRLQPSDAADITELARHTYEGKDFIQTDFRLWMGSDDQRVLPVAVVYCGPVLADTASGAGTEAARDDDGDEAAVAERLEYVSRVVSIEVCLFLDGGSTSWLYALRVHPAFRGLSLSSYLHSYMIAASQQRPAVRRLREAVEQGNSVSLHLGAKHSLKPVYSSLYCWIDREQHDGRLAWVERLLVQRGVHLADVRLRDESGDNSGWLSRGQGSDLLSLRAAKSSHAAFQYLLQYWICYEFTADNVRMLIEDPAKAHELVVSHSAPHAAAVDVQAASLTQFRADFTSRIQSFTVYATDATHCLLHLHHALQRQTPHRHDKHKYARSMYFVPTFFEQAVKADTPQQQDAWKADMSFILLERHIEHT